MRPAASETERAWVGRSVIVVATLAALGISFAGENDPDLAILRTISQFFVLAMAFSCQLLPVTVDILFVRRGTAAGALSGIAAGVLAVLTFLLWGDPQSTAAVPFFVDLERLLDAGFSAACVNTIVFVVVSRFTRALPRDRVLGFERDLLGRGYQDTPRASAR